MSSIIRTASVKVMRSYDYCHFEVAMTIENDEDITLIEIDNVRKNCMRLADKAVEQYKIAKVNYDNKSQRDKDKLGFEKDCQKIAAKSEQDRTIKEMAMLKSYVDGNWKAQFDYDYDYEDDREY